MSEEQLKDFPLIEEGLPNPNPSETSLDNISTEFKGILMDLHSSMISPGDPASNNDNEVTILEEKLLLDSNASTPSDFGALDPDRPDVDVDKDVKKDKKEKIDVLEPSWEPQGQDLPTTVASVATTETPTGDTTMTVATTTETPTADTAMTANTASHSHDFTGDDFVGNFTAAPHDDMDDTTVTVNMDVDDTDGHHDVDETININHIDVDNPANPDDPRKIKLLLLNLPENPSEEMLTGLFEPFGTILSCDLKEEERMARICLDNLAGGLTAIEELNNLELAGKKLRVVRSRLNGESEKQRLSKLNNDVEEEVITCFKLFLRGMKFGTEDEVKSLLDEYGRIVEIELVKAKNAYVHFEEAQSGVRAIRELHGKLLPGYPRPLSLTIPNTPIKPDLLQLLTIKLKVTNLPEDLDAYELRGLFQPYGLVVKVVLNKSKFQCLRKAVVDLEQLGDLRSAIRDLGALNFGMGKGIVVEPWKPKEKVQPTGWKKPTQNSGFIPPLLPPEALFDPYDYAQYGPGPTITDPYHVPGPTRSLFGGRGGGGGGHGGVGGGRGRGLPYARPPSELIPRDARRTGGMGMGAGMFVGFGGGGKRGRGGGGRGGGAQFGSQRAPAPDYSYDEYYQDVSAQTARNHLLDLEEEYAQFSQQMGLGRGRGRPKPLFSQQSYSTPDFTADIEEDDYDFAQDMTLDDEITMPQLNLPLGEREYFPPRRNGNPQQQYFQKVKEQQKQRQVATFQAQNLMRAAGYGPAATNEASAYAGGGGGYSQAMPLMNFADDSFSAVPFDYSQLANRRQNMQMQGNPNPQSWSIPGRPGAKVYVNQAGQIRTRGNRGGQKAREAAQRRRRPGLGAPKNANKKPGNMGLSGANMFPIGAGQAETQQQSSTTAAKPLIGPIQPPPGLKTNNTYGTATNNAYGTATNNAYSNPTPTSDYGYGYDTATATQSGGGAAAAGNYGYYGGYGGSYGTKKSWPSKKEKEDSNKEYTDWLSSKAWLTTAIPGVVRPAQPKF